MFGFIMLLLSTVLSSGAEYQPASKQAWINTGICLLNCNGNFTQCDNKCIKDSSDDERKNVDTANITKEQLRFPSTPTATLNARRQLVIKYPIPVPVTMHSNSSDDKRVIIALSESTSNVWTCLGWTKHNDDIIADVSTNHVTLLVIGQDGLMLEAEIQTDLSPPPHRLAIAAMSAVGLILLITGLIIVTTAACQQQHQEEEDYCNDWGYPALAANREQRLCHYNGWRRRCKYFVRLWRRRSQGKSIEDSTNKSPPFLTLLERSGGGAGSMSTAASLPSVLDPVGLHDSPQQPKLRTAISEPEMHTTPKKILFHKKSPEKFSVPEQENERRWIAKVYSLDFEVHGIAPANVDLSTEDLLNSSPAHRNDTPTPIGSSTCQSTRSMSLTDNNNLQESHNKSSGMKNNNYLEVIIPAQEVDSSYSTESPPMPNYPPPPLPNLEDSEASIVTQDLDEEVELIMLQAPPTIMEADEFMTSDLAYQFIVKADIHSSFTDGTDASLMDRLMCDKTM